ncbi:MAG: hypothetical protein KZQ85_10985 [Candidatus Thiodiazotropha sp. (ex Myrtea sp. 'scaly one' KF741663)]|nr:hypothetical protein [Candidatus Thiodiazotropha sp. (ex Myrtea sp. 'scaly one' KF741663)]
MLKQWFGNPGQVVHLYECQFREKLNALPPWGGEFDWDTCPDGAQSLGRHHPTVVWTYEGIDQAVEEVKNMIELQSPETYRKFLGSIRLP